MIHNETDTLHTGLQVVRESSFGCNPTDFPVALLAMVEGFECVISSMITLLVHTFISHTFCISHQRRSSSLVHTSTKLPRTPHDGALVRR